MASVDHKPVFSPAQIAAALAAAPIPNVLMTPTLLMQWQSIGLMR